MAEEQERHWITTQVQMLPEAWLCDYFSSGPGPMPMFTAVLWQDNSDGRWISRIVLATDDGRYLVPLAGPDHWEEAGVKVSTSAGI